MGGDARIRELCPDDGEAVGYLERSLATSPVWQMGTRTVESHVQRRDPRLLDFMANAKNAPLGELEFDVLTWAITRWYQAGRPADGRLTATVGELAFALYGARHGGVQYALLRDALDHLYNVSLDLTILSVDDHHETWRASKRRRIIQELTVHERVTDGTARQAATVEIRLGSWLVEQLDARTVAAIGWQVLRGLGGIAKRLAIYLAAHSQEFEPITQHTERLTIMLTDELYEEFGVSAARERARRASLTRAAERIAERDARYKQLVVERIGPSRFVLHVDRPIVGSVLVLPGVTA